MQRDPVVIASINSKGGVGKTSFCHHITAPLRDLGKKLLLVDLDYQGNLSNGLLGTEAQAIPAEQTTAAFFDDSLHAGPEIILETPLNKKPPKKKEVRDPEDVAFIIPANKSLHSHMIPVPDNGTAPLFHPEKLFCVQQYLEEVKHDYDIILIDCHPSLELTAWNALIAADFVICPFQPEDYGAQGISMIQEAMDRVGDHYNPKLKLLGYLLNKVQRNGLHRTFEALLREYYGTDVFFTVIPLSTTYAESVTSRMPIGRAKPRVKANEPMQQLAEELLGRIEQLREQPRRYYYFENQQAV